jgi:hypothetical protein
MAMMLRSLDDIQREIRVTTHAIKMALWLPDGADVELARTLISKRMGLRVLAGERVIAGLLSQPQSKVRALPITTASAALAKP